MQLHSEIIPAHREETHTTIGTQPNRNPRAQRRSHRLTIAFLSQNQAERVTAVRGRAAASSSRSTAASPAMACCALLRRCDGEHGVVARASLSVVSVPGRWQPVPRSHSCARERAVRRVQHDGRLRRKRVRRSRGHGCYKDTLLFNLFSSLSLLLHPFLI